MQTMQKIRNEISGLTAMGKPYKVTPQEGGRFLQQRTQGGLLCMNGGVYSDEKCLVCGRSFKDDGRRGLFCPEHPEQSATKFKVIFKGLCKRFRDYQSAQRLLTGLRYKVDEATFDERDYQEAKPLGFETLALRWLEVKKLEIKRSSCRKIENHIARAVRHWGEKNIKEIGYAEIEDFLLGQKLRNGKGAVSTKTRSNIRSTLHAFWMWLRRRRILSLAQIPEFPEMPFELSWRKTIDKGTQDAILNEVHRISYDANPKICIGIRFLATYVSLRPNELLNIKEGDFDFGLRAVIIPNPKEKRAKTVPLLDEDIQVIRSFPRGLPGLYFFRHAHGVGGVSAGQRFGGNYLYRWWKRACANLGIEGVDLYGGTRHSSARALREFFSPEQIRRATMHNTNKAFERYFQIELEDVRRVYGKTKTADNGLTTDFCQPEKGKLLKL